MDQTGSLRVLIVGSRFVILGIPWIPGLQCNNT